MTQEKVHLTLIQPTNIKVDDEFDHVILPGIEGDFGVYPGHTPLTTIIRPGVISLYKGETATYLAIHDGFVTVENDQITVVCDILESNEEIDKNRAKQARERAEKRIKSNDSEIDFRRAESALRRAMARIKTFDNQA